jgi:hypothetical protein
VISAFGETLIEEKKGEKVAVMDRDLHLPLSTPPNLDGNLPITKAWVSLLCLLTDFPAGFDKQHVVSYVPKTSVELLGIQRHGAFHRQRRPHLSTTFTRRFTGTIRS